MSLALYNIVRIAGDAALKPAPFDASTGAVPVFCLADDVQIALGYFINAVAISDVTLLASLHVEIRPWTANTPAPDPNTVSPVLSGSTSSVASTMTAATWAAGTAETGAVVFTSAQTALVPVGDYWLTFYGVTSDGTPRRITLADGPVCFVGDGAGANAGTAVFAGTAQSFDATITNGANTVVVTFAAPFVSVPKIRGLVVGIPSGSSGNFWANPLLSTVTTSGFTAALSGNTDAAGYTVSGIASL